MAGVLAPESSLQARLEALNRRVGLGWLASTVALCLALLFWALAPVYPAATALRSIFLAGFIGGATNTLALIMLFNKVRFLPGSGVLLNRREAIIASLAETMERHILNPSLIEARVRELSANIDRGRLRDGVNAVIDELRQDMIEFVNSPDSRARIAAAVRSEGSFMSDMADALGVVTYANIADRICAGLTTQVRHFQVDDAMIDRAMDQFGSIDDFLLQPGNPLVRRHYGSEQSVAQLLFETMDARQLVVDKLSSYDARQIRDIVSENIRDHLAWLEVFGVILGIVIQSAVILLDWLIGQL